MSENWFQHALRRTGWQPTREVIALGTLLLVLALIVGALYLSSVAAEATTGRVLSDLIAQRDELERTNEQLRAEIASYRTVARLIQRARELGFSLAPASSIEWLAIAGYNPNVGEAPAPVLQETEVPPVYDETFGGWLQQQWDSLRSQFENFGEE
jgi:hypothetical protein